MFTSHDQLALTPTLFPHTFKQAKNDTQFETKFLKSTRIPLLKTKLGKENMFQLCRVHQEGPHLKAEGPK